MGRAGVNNLSVALIIIVIMSWVIYRLYQQVRIAKLREEMAKNEIREKKIKKDIKYAEIDDLVDGANDRLRERRMRDGK